MKIDIHISNATPKELLELSEFLNDSFGIKKLAVKSVSSGSHTNAPYKSGKWQIPFKSYIGTKANPEYTKALKLCKKWNTRYDEAVKLESKPAPIIFDTTEELHESIKDHGPHWKDVIHKSANPVHEPILSGSDS